jgi:nitrate/TMAO reductase-like tetraheme cytochrome c subunit
MKAKLNRSHLVALVLMIVAVAGWNLFAGSSATHEAATESSGAVTRDSGSQLSGQELWSMNCQRCHNMRSPVMYTDTQWQVIVHHMRVRANLTGADARAIADFLKSGSK